MKTPACTHFALLLVLSLSAAAPLMAGTIDAGSDTFATAPAIDQDDDYSGNDFSNNTNIIAFTSQGGEPGHGSNGIVCAQKTAWWRWTAHADGYCTVDTLRGSDVNNHVLDTVIAVYTGNVVNNLIPVGSNDNHTGLVQPAAKLSSLTFFAKKDTTYRIAVDARDVNEVNASKFNVMLQLRLLELKKTSRASTLLLDINTAGLGMVTLNTTATGSLSGKLALGAKTYPFAGAFTLDGRFQATFAQKGPANTPAVPLTLRIDGTGDGAFDLTSGNGKTAVGYLPEKLVFNAQQVNPTTGTYPLYMDHGSNAAVGGEGVLILTIKSTGAVTAVGNNVDGLPITYSSAIYKRTSANYAEMPAYKSLLGGKAGLIIAPQLSEAGLIDEVDSGNSVYLRNPAPGTTFYPQGLAFEFDLTGSTYTKPPVNNRALGFLNGTNGVGTMTTVNSGGELNGDLVDTVNLSDKNKFTFAINTNKGALTLNTTTGLVTGSITAPGGKKRTVKGVLTYTNGEPSIRGYATGTTRNIAIKVTP